MNTHEILMLKVLKLKELNTGHAGGKLIDQLFDENPEKADELTKNVCARIPLELAQEMELIGGLLDLNKRELITIAVNDFLDKARAVMQEFDAMPEAL